MSIYIYIYTYIHIIVYYIILKHLEMMFGRGLRILSTSGGPSGAEPRSATCPKARCAKKGKRTTLKKRPPPHSRFRRVLILMIMIMSMMMMIMSGWATGPLRKELMCTFIGWSFIGINLFSKQLIAKCWSFIGMNLLKACMCWYEFAKSITNEAPTSKGKYHSRKVQSKSQKQNTEHDINIYIPKVEVSIVIGSDRSPITIETYK